MKLTSYYAAAFCLFSSTLASPAPTRSCASCQHVSPTSPSTPDLIPGNSQAAPTATRSPSFGGLADSYIKQAAQLFHQGLKKREEVAEANEILEKREPVAPVTSVPADVSVTGDSLSQSTNSAANGEPTGGTASNATASSSNGASESATEVLSASATGTEMAVFTANGGLYTASAYSGIVVVDGFKTLSAGGPDGLVGGVRVTVTSDVIIQNGQSVMFTAVTESAAAAAATTASEPGGAMASLSNTSSGAAPASSASGSGSASSTASATADVGGSSGSDSNGSGTVQSSSSAAGAVPTAKPKNAVAAIGGMAALMCLLG